MTRDEAIQRLCAWSDEIDEAFEIQDYEPWKSTRRKVAEAFAVLKESERQRKEQARAQQEAWYRSEIAYLEQWIAGVPLNSWERPGLSELLKERRDGLQQLLSSTPSPPKEPDSPSHP